MDPVEAYQTYIAAKLHFNDEKYDAFKYKFRTGVPDVSYYKRRDKYHFEKAARKYPKKNQLIAFYVSNIIEDVDWIGNFDDENYLAWYGRMQRLDYTFKSEISNLWQTGLGFDRLFIQDDGSHPLMIRELLAGNITLETVAMFDKTVGVVKEMPEFDPIVWPPLRKKIIKYKPFMPFDRAKSMEILTSIFKDRV